MGSLQFPNGTSPLVSRTAVYTGNQISECSPPEMPLSCFYNHLYLERADVLRERQYTKGLKLHLYTEGTSRGLESSRVSLIRTVKFGQACQTICSALGAPSKVFYKSEDKMKIHSPDANRRAAHRRSDYFFNYFTLGLVSFKNFSHFII